MNRPSLTIAVPFYRGIDYLKLAVSSVLAQSNPNWQLVVCDDRGGDEPVAELVDSLHDARISYLRNERNLGMVGNWNRCLSIGGSFVSLLHADDQLEPSYVETMLSAIADHPNAAAWCCRTRIIDANGNPVFSFPDFWKRVIEPSPSTPYTELHGEEALTRILKGNFVFCPTLCYNRNILKGDLFDARWHQVQDLDFIYRILLEGRTIVRSNAVAYAYRRHGDNATAQQTASLLRFQEESAIYDQTLTHCLERSWVCAAEAARHKRIIKLSLIFFACSDLVRGRVSPFCQKINYLSKLAFRGSMG